MRLVHYTHKLHSLLNFSLYLLSVIHRLVSYRGLTFLYKYELNNK